MVKIALSDVCGAFRAKTVGTKADPAIMQVLPALIEGHDSSQDEASGQHSVKIPSAYLPMLSTGVGRRTSDVDDYVKAAWRGRVDVFLRRSKAAPAESAVAIVYTRLAYLADPDVKAEEVERLGDATHVLVGIFASAGPNSPPAPWTFVRNLAGANNEELAMSGDEIRAKAQVVAAYHSEWCVVADGD